MRIFVLLFMAFAISSNSLAEIVNLEKISGKISIVIWDCKDQFNCLSGNEVLVESDEWQLTKQFVMGPVEHDGAELYKSLDPIQKKIFSFDVNITKELDTSSGNFQYMIFGR